MLTYDTDSARSSRQPFRGGDRTRSRARAWASALCCCMIASVANAAEPTKTEIAVARGFFDQAVAAEHEGRWREAAENLEKAIAIKETAGLRYHLGFAKENQGLLVEAMIEYERAAGLVRSGVSTEDVERFLAPKLAEVRKRVPRLTVQIPPDVKDAELRIDGVPVKRELLGTPLPLNPGTHALVVFAPGRRPFHMQVSLGEGSAVSQAAELVPDSISQVGPVQVASTNAIDQTQTGVGRESNPARTWTLIGEGAIATTGLAIGFGYLIASRSAQDDLDEAHAHIDSAIGATCKMPTPEIQADCDTLATHFADPARKQDVATAGFVVAGVAAVAFATTWFVWKSGNRFALSATPVVGARERSL